MIVVVWRLLIGGVPPSRKLPPAPAEEENPAPAELRWILRATSSSPLAILRAVFLDHSLPDRLALRSSSGSSIPASFCRACSSKTANWEQSRLILRCSMCALDWRCSNPRLQTPDALSSSSSSSSSGMGASIDPNPEEREAPAEEERSRSRRRMCLTVLRTSLVSPSSSRGEYQTKTRHSSGISQWTGMRYTRVSGRKLTGRR
mmetsp:Transcript_17986/g.52143  ORF Transcript_17986/g.52143 Transcript_17986/m.52143 type:complete len:203 (+) Transcript_17986:625-1233(+)